MKLRFLKKTLKHPATQAALCALVAGYIRLVRATARFQRDIHPAAQPYLSGDAQCILAFWHGRMLLLPAFRPPKRKTHVLISGHRDGVMIAQVITHFGIGTIEGSTSKKSLSGLRNILRAVKEGDNISITPDGPRGPMQVAAPGIAYVARTTGLPILPVTWASSPNRRLNKSWDRFMIPLPFARIAYVIGAPIFIDRDTEEEATRQEIEAEMNRLTTYADHQVGILP